MPECERGLEGCRKALPRQEKDHAGDNKYEERQKEHTMTYHHMEADQVVESLHSNRQTGLTESQVTQIRQESGMNKLQEKKPKTMAQRLLTQFQDVMIIILLIAAALSFAIHIYEGNYGELFEPALILLIVVLNAVMGVLQESKAEKALDALKNLSAPHARVIRDGTETVIDAVELVSGDIIRLEAGDFVPADARLLRAVSLKCEESALTGESVPAEKDAAAQVAENAPLGDRRNMVYSGCSVVYGTALAVVTATGMHTEMGKIAGLLAQEESTTTPLQQKLAHLGKVLGFVALGACGVIFLVGLLNNIPVIEIFMTSVSLAVSAIPEGLPAIVTVVLSIGVQRMVKRNAIIRRLPAVETLGSASVICSDKTGTLTQNRMTLVKAYADGMAAPEDITTECSEPVRQLLMYGALCTDGTVAFLGMEEKHIGDPTETAIVLAAHRNGMPKDALNHAHPRLGEIPFDSDRKLMTTIHPFDGAYYAVVKGAFDMMAPRCTAGDLKKAREINDAMAENALRVLAIGIRRLDQLPENPTTDTVEQDLTFVGLVGMIDPPRPEAKEAVDTCRQAGIKPVMITGDHVVTAAAIARELGILQGEDKSITGAELDQMTEEALDQEVSHIAVYARVTPENKIRIVKAWQKKGHVVSMTGNEVNDTPALKAADIGCAMGITGTDVAKGAADMTLTDDNFATIVEAVREGRGIYDNIRKVVGYLLGTNIGEVLVVFIAMLVWHVSPLLSMQLLWVNLVTDSLPAIALGTEAVDKDVMTRRPKPKDESIFAHGYGLQVVLQGMMFGILSLIAFAYGRGLAVENSLAAARTVTFITLALSQVVQAYNMRSDRSLFSIGVFTNLRLNLAALASIAMMALVVFVPPVASAFQLVQLPTNAYLVAVGLACIPLAVMEMAKALRLIGRK